MGLLRFLLAISVVLTHSSSIFGFSLVGGQIAVQAFYIISGFYMTLILNEKYIGTNNSYKLFITNRLLRLFPVYWTVLLLTILLGVITLVFTHGNNLSYFAEYVNYYKTMSFGSLFFLIFTNIFLFLQDTVMFLGLDITSGQLFFTSNQTQITPSLYKFLLVPQAWTIGVEIAFYIIAPFLVRQKLKVIFPLILISVLLRIVLVQHGLNADPWSYRFFPTELVFFLFGIIAYRMYTFLRNKEINSRILQIILLLILSFTVFFNFIHFDGKYYLYLISFFVALPFIFSLSKKWKKDRYIGELSYPIYISHMLLMSCLNKLDLEINSTYTVILVILTIVFSVIINEILTKRIESLRQKRLLND